MRLQAASSTPPPRTKPTSRSAGSKPPGPASKLTTRCPRATRRFLFPLFLPPLSLVTRTDSHTGIALTPSLSLSFIQWHTRVTIIHASPPYRFPTFVMCAPRPCVRAVLYVPAGRDGYLPSHICIVMQRSAATAETWPTPVLLGRVATPTTACCFLKRPPARETARSSS